MDTPDVKVYNKTYITLLPDTNHINITVNNQEQSYHNEIWVGLFLLFIFIIIYWFKKPAYFISNNKTVPEHYSVHNELEKRYQSIELPKQTPNLDLSKLGEINIKNEKI